MATEKLKSIRESEVRLQEKLRLPEKKRGCKKIKENLGLVGETAREAETAREE